MRNDVVEKMFFVSEDDAIADPKLKWAIGADLPFLDYFSINLQFSQEIQNMNFTGFDNIKTINSIIGGLSGNFFEETLSIKLGGICNIYCDDEETNVDYLLIPQIDCLYFDSLTLTLVPRPKNSDHIYGNTLSA